MKIIIFILIYSYPVIRSIIFPILEGMKVGRKWLDWLMVILDHFDRNLIKRKPETGMETDWSLKSCLHSVNNKTWEWSSLMAA